MPVTLTLEARGSAPTRLRATLVDADGRRFGATATDGYGPLQARGGHGVQDGHSQNLKPFGLAPWQALMGSGAYHRFTAGLLEVWVLDQRLFKSPPTGPDTEAKTLLGHDQRTWLMDTLASRAPFTVICSPCTLSPVQGEKHLLPPIAPKWWAD